MQKTFLIFDIRYIQELSTRKANKALQDVANAVQNLHTKLLSLLSVLATRLKPTPLRHLTISCLRYAQKGRELHAGFG